MPGKGQPYKTVYGESITKSGARTPTIDIYALRQAPGVVSSQTVNRSNTGDRLMSKPVKPMKSANPRGR